MNAGRQQRQQQASSESDEQRLKSYKNPSKRHMSSRQRRKHWNRLWVSIARNKNTWVCVCVHHLASCGAIYLLLGAPRTKKRFNRMQPLPAAATRRQRLRQKATSAAEGSGSGCVFIPVTPFGPPSSRLSPLTLLSPLFPSPVSP